MSEMTNGVNSTRPPQMHPDSDVQSLPGTGTKVWARAHIREDAVVGSDCIIGEAAYIDREVLIGDRCKIGNAAQIFYPALIEDECFIGPGAILTNDRYPRACIDGKLKGLADWSPEGVKLRRGCSIGANATILAGVEIGENAMIGAGSVVTKDVPANRTWMGAKLCD